MPTKPHLRGRSRPVRVIAMILAGGEGKRLHPLTRDRCKPAVPFGGSYRIIDLVLSNFLNSGLAKIKLLTQYKSHSLETHVSRAWSMAAISDDYVECLPAQQRLGREWYRGSADAIYQSLHVIMDEQATDVCIFGADHVYQMDIGQMLAEHVEKDADATVAVNPVPATDAQRFGIVIVDDEMRIVDFEEKPLRPSLMPGRDTHALASMGNYIFRTDVLLEALQADASTDSTHDFGHDILPSLAGRNLLAYDFQTNVVDGNAEHNRGYWCDVGSIDSYYEASMDVISVLPRLNLHNPVWPLRSAMRHLPPAKFVHMDEPGERVGQAIQSMVCSGCIVSGGLVSTSILGPRVRINSYARVHGSILFDGVEVGRGANLQRVIVDKDVVIPPGVRIGYDHDRDRARGFTVSESGVVVVPKRARIDA